MSSAAGCCCATKENHCASEQKKSPQMPASSHGVLHMLAMFGSFSTLFCCALPALLVALGAGSVMVSLVSAVPQLIWISEHKTALFIFAGCMLTISGIARYRSRNAPCPTDAAKARACSRMRRISFGIWCFSLTMYVVGFYFAFIAVYFV